MLLHKWFPPPIAQCGYRQFALTVGWIGSSRFFSLFSAIFFLFSFFIFSFFTEFFILLHKTFCTLKNTTSEIWVRMKSRVVNFSTTRHSIFLSKKKGYFASCHSCMFAAYNHCRTGGRSKDLEGVSSNKRSFCKEHGFAYSIMVKKWGRGNDTIGTPVPPALNILRMFTHLFVILHFLRFLSFHSWVKIY